MKQILFIFCVINCITNLSYAQDQMSVNKGEHDLQIIVETKEELKSDVYIDGKKYDSDILELLDPSKISSVNILKDDSTKKLYNTHRPVIIVTTTKKVAMVKPATVKLENNSNSVTTIKGSSFGKTNFKQQATPLIIIDGDTAANADLEALKSDNIKSINVIKGAEAIEKHNSPTGVIIVETKK